jgi:hypothetical protein
MKICKQCLIEKDLESFRLNRKYRENKCKQCNNEARMEPKEKDRQAAYQKAYSKTNKETIAVKKAIYRKTNKETLAVKKVAYCKANKKAIAARTAAWKKDNKAAVNAATVRRRSAKLNRTPKWTTKEDLETIKQIYIVANQFSKSFGTEYQVDHIIPLQGELVSGLHVPSNLQIITAKENQIKGNKYTVSA